LCPCSWGFEFFSPGALAVFLKEGVCWKCYPLHGSFCGADYLFLPSARGLEFPLFDGGMWTLLQLCGACQVSALWETGLLAPAEQWIATQWRSWDSSSWRGETGLSCREVQGEVLGFCAPWECRPSGATCRVAVSRFPPFSGESGVLIL
jgi:hypothetical protein